MNVLKRPSALLFGLIALFVGLSWFFFSEREPGKGISSTSGGRRANMINEATRAKVIALQNLESRFNKDLWTEEIEAQRHGRVFETLWDQFNNGVDWQELLMDSGATLVLGEAVVWDEMVLPYGIREARFDDRERRLGGEALGSWIERHKSDGWVVSHVEFRLRRYESGTLATGGPKGVIDCRLALTNTVRNERLFVEGALQVEWGSATVPNRQEPSVSVIDCRRLEIRFRAGTLPFETVFETVVASPEHAASIDPLLVRDLDGDGYAEIILANRNLVFRRTSETGYRAAPLCPFPPGVISTAVFGDVDGDGSIDLVCQKGQGLVVLRGSPEGLFDEPERIIWTSPAALPYPIVVTCGDVDGDGDLDLFLGQYRSPYEGGSLPTPFYDANDGYPAYLLRNNGRLEFADVTEEVGLAGKRKRRIYSASLVDIDGQVGLDLVVVSDFAGADLYLNDGHGAFRDVTTSWLGDALGFGMAHTFSDFNVDGQLDLLMIGMTSPTVDRLDHLGLWRSGLTEDRSLRARMAQGNRLFLSGDDGRFHQDKMSQSVARAGWAWGCGAADFNNDGYPDVFIGNGFDSRASVRDYESEYWLHDAFVADSIRDPAVYLYFEEKSKRTRGVGHSYGGYESNRLYLNLMGNRFVEGGHLLGLGRQSDTRNVVADDLDGDGRVDLVLTHYERWPEAKQTLRIYENKTVAAGNWIGFRLQAEASRMTSTIGTAIVVEVGGKRIVATYTTGDSYRSQRSGDVHFGLGSETTVDRVTVRWPDGREMVARNLLGHRYYRLTPDGGGWLSGRE